VWTVVVVVGAKTIKGALLIGRCRCRWIGRLFLERLVHALVSTILLRLAWLDALGHDTELNPPHGEPRKPP
jgi:hypothetical protein